MLLKTAIAKVSSAHYTTDAHILLDEGAQRSFITEKLAEELKIQQTGTETIYLACFGNDIQNIRQVPTATVFLITDEGEKIAIDVAIVPTIAVPLSNIQREVTSLKYIRGLKLAHPITDESVFEISLLIGADSYWNIVRNHAVRGNGPTAVQSKIGYLLSGPLPASEQHFFHSLHVKCNNIPTKLP